MLIATVSAMSDQTGRWPLLLRLSRGLVAEQPDLAMKMSETIRREVPFYRSHGVSTAETNRSAREHVEALVGRASFPDGPETAPRELGERRARSGVELVDVLDGLRVGTAFLWGRIVDYARRTGSATDGELVDLATEVWLMHEAYAHALISGYRNEHSRVLLTKQQQRLGLIYGLLTARGREAASPWEAVDRLGLPREAPFVVVAAMTAPAARMPLPRIEAFLAVSDIPSAWVMVGNVQTGIVSASESGWRRLLATEVATWGARAGASPLSDDFARISAAVRFARIALSTAGAGALADFDEQPVAMASAGSPDVSGHVVRSVLGRLLALSAAERDTLLHTLDAWYSAGSSLSGVATVIGVHENTVRNRLRRVAAVTGRDPLRPRESAELFFALAGYRTLPPVGTGPEASAGD